MNTTQTRHQAQAEETCVSLTAVEIAREPHDVWERHALHDARLAALEAGAIALADTLADLILADERENAWNAEIRGAGLRLAPFVARYDYAYDLAERVA